MAFLYKRRERISYDTPQAMYQDNKAKTILGPLDYQSNMINEYMKELNTNNVALELPTGSGKTLIGLLIGEYRRKMKHETVLFLCTTNQLVKQVVEQANKKYGINAIAFCGRQKDYNISDWVQYSSGEAIGVTTYSSFFATNSRFDEVDIIIMDDVHSSEDYIISNWTVNISKNDIAFEQIAAILKTILSENDYINLTADETSICPENWCNLVPMPLLIERISEINSILQININDERKFAYMNIAENLKDCNIYISNKQIQIRPWIPPTMFHNAFSNAKQRILMSATLGKSGELERITGISKIKKLPMIDNWDQRSIGRKLFIFPDLAMEKSEKKKIIPELQLLMKKSVFLVPNKSVERKFAENLKEICNTDVFDAGELESNKDVFLKSENSSVILANRFEGIDFPDDSSRLLFVYRIPKLMNLQENFLVSKMSAATIYTERIKTRIIQAFGRCTRNANDYAVICVFGKSIMNEFTKEEKQMQYPAELRAELSFGLETSEGYKTITDIITNVKLFLDQKSPEWQDANEAIIERRNEYMEDEIKNPYSSCYDQLNAVAKFEVNYQSYIWTNNYIKAIEQLNTIISTLTSPKLKGYKCYWIYIKGCLQYYLYKQGAQQYGSISKRSFEEAAGLNVPLKWLNTLSMKLFSGESNTTNTEDYFEDVIDGIENKLQKYSSPQKFERYIEKILGDLNSEDGKKFEKGQEEFGKLLGCFSKNDDSQGAPDPYWIINLDMVVVFEDKIYKTDKKIPIEDVREAGTHHIWIKRNVDGLSPNAKILTIFVTTSKEIEEKARQFADGIYYMHKSDFMSFVNSYIAVIRKEYNTFNENGDYGWRNDLYENLQTQKLLMSDFIELLTKKKLAEI
ncbi:DEAD/DEAH box helicase family protein [Coprobacillus sp. AF33-1AC]|uniref:DEAD/DEAH box helicase family protein n=1 Tax=Coprobacillus sp. AF33-1AC TaxID=2292032 RepID=UPI000E48ED0F|nr:DEAD/DEAH box helicase family protein [Coprobacillus sp. AF33-1AC]RHM60265.1 hypothetical protein DWZ53_07580 [Coprobacillus sp. AF33-1AC]RHR83986.1 hypothetical protein DWW38_14800 [Coprobacillus sp. AF15-30]